METEEIDYQCGGQFGKLSYYEWKTMKIKTVARALWVFYTAWMYTDEIVTEL